MSPTISHFDRTNHKRYKRKPPGAALRISADSLRICNFNAIAPSYRDRLVKLTGVPERGPATPEFDNGQVDLVVRADKDLLKCIEDLLTDDAVEKTAKLPATISRRPTNSWADVAGKAITFADHLLNVPAQLRRSLADYECANVVDDEIRRSVDALINLHQNREYFTHAIRGVTTFLPLNQPIYASVCFGVLPSLMSNDVAVRPPTAMHATYRQLNECLRLEHFFPTLRVSYELNKERFCQERSAVTEAVIFTGTHENGEIVRRQFSPETLFILNGSGHNPLVVTETADLDVAIESSLRVVLYNQGQDCAGPNAILVHREKHTQFVTRLTHELTAIEDRCGHYSDPKNIVGPNTDVEATAQVAEGLVGITKARPNAVVYGGALNPAQRMIMPTVIDVPLRSKAAVTEIGLREWFAPVFFIQRYETDGQLQWYFEHPSYHDNAMYVSVFGESSYVRSLIRKGLHTKENILVDTDLHQVERGFAPYGGLGIAASHIAYRGMKRSGATLPQRDIYLYLVKETF